MMSLHVAWLEEESVSYIKSRIQRRERAVSWLQFSSLCRIKLERSRLFLEKCNRATMWMYVNLQFGSVPPFFFFPTVAPLQWFAINSCTIANH